MRAVTDRLVKATVTLNQMIRLVASLAGLLGRKATVNPKGSPLDWPTVNRGCRLHDSGAQRQRMTSV